MRRMRQNPSWLDDFLNAQIASIACLDPGVFVNAARGSGHQHIRGCSLAHFAAYADSGRRGFVEWHIRGDGKCILQNFPQNFGAGGMWTCAGSGPRQIARPGGSESQSGPYPADQPAHDIT